MGALLRDYPVTGFLIFTFVFSWAIWALSPLIGAGSGNLKFFLDMTGAFGPSLVAIWITLYFNAKTPIPRVGLHLLLFAVNTALVLFAAVTIFEMTLDLPTVIGALILADVAAYTLSIPVTHRMSGDIFNSTVNLRIVNWKWGLLALFSVPAVMVAGSIIDWAMGAQFEPMVDLGSAPRTIIIMVAALIPIALFTGPLAQELGWRGYVIPRLMKRYNPVMLALLVGFVWSFWYLPLHFNGFIEDGLEGFVSRFVLLIPLSVLFIWFFIRSRGSVFVMVLTHTGMVFSLMLLPRTPEGPTYGLYLLMALLLIIVFSDPLMRDRTEAGRYLRADIRRDM